MLLLVSALIFATKFAFAALRCGTIGKGMMTVGTFLVDHGDMLEFVIE